MLNGRRPNFFKGVLLILHKLSKRLRNASKHVFFKGKSLFRRGKFKNRACGAALNCIPKMKRSRSSLVRELLSARQRSRGTFYHSQNDWMTRRAVVSVYLRGTATPSIARNMIGPPERFRSSCRLQNGKFGRKHRNEKIKYEAHRCPLSLVKYKVVGTFSRL